MAEDGASITISGLNELGQRLKIFSDVVANQIVKEAVRTSIKIFRDEAALRAPLGSVEHYLGKGEKKVLLKPGNLKKNIKIKVVKNMPKGTFRFEVFVKNKEAWYAKFIERGTSKMAAQPFMAPAFESKRQEVVDTFKETVLRAIREGGI